MTDLLSSFVACLCKRDSGRRTNRRSEVSYSDNLLPLSTLTGRIDLKEGRHELKILILRQKNNVQDTSE